MTALSAQGLSCIGIYRRGCGALRHRQARDRSRSDRGRSRHRARAARARRCHARCHSVGGAEAIRIHSRDGHAPVSRLVLVASITPALVQSDVNSDGLPPSVFDEIVDGLGKDRPAYLAAAAPGFFGGEDAVSSELMAWGIGLATRASLRTSVALVNTYGVDLRAEFDAVARSSSTSSSGSLSHISSVNLPRSQAGAPARLTARRR
jgi:hypothetical protein